MEKGVLNSEIGQGKFHCLDDANANILKRHMQKIPGRELIRGRECLDGKKQL
jgi:hypothetical protein